MTVKLSWLWCVLLVVPLIALACAPAARPPEAVRVVEIFIPNEADFTGPWADVNKYKVAASDATYKWWNEEVGKKLGVKIVWEWYDCRYDAATVSTAYARVLARKPVAWVGFGGPSVAALKGRVADDKIPLIMTTCSYGYDWVAGMKWIIHSRPTYVHEAIGALDYIIKHRPNDEKLPLKVVDVSNAESPGFKDYGVGFEKNVKILLDKYPGKIEFLGTMWAPLAPVDLIDLTRPFVDKGVNIFWAIGTTPQQTGIIKACQTLTGKAIPIITSTHTDLTTVSKIIPLEALEGSYEAVSVSSNLNYDIRAFKEIWSKYLPAGMDPKADWTHFAAQAMQGCFLLTKAVEQAIADVGAENVNGQAIYNAYLKMDLNEKECFGILRGARWTMASPFPVDEFLGVQLNTVKGGKRVQVTKEWIPSPLLSKW